MSAETAVFRVQKCDLSQYRCSHSLPLKILKLAIAGDLHGIWSQEDNELLRTLQPDGVLFVGDLGEGDIKLVKEIKTLPIPTALILGNHDRGHDRTGETLKRQLRLLGDLHCAWRLRRWSIPKISIVGARPCSSGGGFYLAPEVLGVFGQLSIEESISKIVAAAREAPEDAPLVILAHAGPTGLGSSADSPCGRDWKAPAVDWGDKDLELAIDQIRKERVPDLVVFGHMHHSLKGTQRSRSTYIKDRWGTVYLNTACVPRKFVDSDGNHLSHFSWVEFVDGKLSHVSHRWFSLDHSIAYQQTLL